MLSSHPLPVLADWMLAKCDDYCREEGYPRCIQMFVHLSISVAMLKIRSRAKKGEGQLGGWLVQIQCVCVCMDPSYLPPFWHAFVVRPRFLRATVLKRNSEVTLAI